MATLTKAHSDRQYAAAQAAVIAGWQASGHALAQAGAKGFHPFAVMAAAGAPTVAYPSGDAHPGQWRHIRDGIVAVVEPATKRIVTVYVNVEETELRPDQL
jgi:hypothetical protein